MNSSTLTPRRPASARCHLAQRSAAQAIKAALEAAGVVFIQENGGGAGVRLARREGDG